MRPLSVIEENTIGKTRFVTIVYTDNSKQHKFVCGHGHPHVSDCEKCLKAIKEFRDG